MRILVLPQKIDQQEIYPCICSRRGHLKQIVLTDALGCDRCSSIFVIQGDRDTLVQVGGFAPDQRAWHWYGAFWQLCRHGESKLLPIDCGEGFFSSQRMIKAGLLAILPLILLITISPISTLTIILLLSMVLSAVFFFGRYRH